MSQLPSIPTLDSLPRGLQQDGAIGIALEEGVPILRASRTAQTHIEELLQKQKSSSLTPDEEQKLDQYEAVDDYLSYLNRLTRNPRRQKARMLIQIICGCSCCAAC